MPRCCVKGCESNSSIKDPNISFHRLPLNIQTRTKWIQNIGRHNWNPPINTFICCLHFEKDCINKTLNVTRLKDNSFPTIFPQGMVQRNVLDATGCLSQQQRKVLSSTTHNIKCDHTYASSSTQQVSTFMVQKMSNKIKTQKNKIKRLQRKVTRQTNKIWNLESVLTTLQKENLINDETSSLLKDCAGPKEFLERQIRKTKNLSLPKKYGEEIRKFALTLDFLSPKAYRYIRSTYKNCIPHPHTLTKWYQHTDCEPGFTKEAFQTLKLKADSSMTKILCCLVIDEMSIRKGLYWDASKKKFYGRIDTGLNFDSDALDQANESFVMLLTAINGSWKIPVGYFLVSSLTGEQKCSLVKKCLTLAYETGVKVVALTCDGPSSNITMLKELGCDIMHNPKETSFVYLNNTVHIFLDPCHMVKLIRNTFGELKRFTNETEEINFNFIEKLIELQETEGLHLGTKLTKTHVHFFKQKMKVRLATQLFSSSVADALNFCKNVLNIENFSGSSSTAKFIQIINDVFDVLNSHSMRPPGWKKAICAQNIQRINKLFTEAERYINNLKLSSGQYVVSSRRKTGFIGLLVDMNSALNLFNYLVEDEKLLKYLPLYKVSQDHLEMFFSAIRSKGGYNNNPNAVQFKAAYKKILIRAEIRDDGMGNCIPLEQINILNCSSKVCPIKNINNLTARSSFVEIPEDDSTLYDNYLHYLNNTQSEYAEHVVMYIAGFVTRVLCKELQCYECLTLIRGSENDFSCNLIKVKSRGGLTYPSRCLLKIVEDTEKIIKPHLKSGGKFENYHAYIFKFLMDHFEYSNILVSKNLEHDSMHKLLLIKGIINKYIDIRFKYYGKKCTERVSSRNFLTKMILFRNE